MHRYGREARSASSALRVDDRVETRRTGRRSRSRRGRRRRRRRGSSRPRRRRGCAIISAARLVAACPSARLSGSSRSAKLVWRCASMTASGSSAAVFGGRAAAARTRRPGSDDGEGERSEGDTRGGSRCHVRPPFRRIRTGPSASAPAEPAAGRLSDDQRPASAAGTSAPTSPTGSSPSRARPS